MAAQPSAHGTKPMALISDEASVVFQRVKPAVIQPSQPDTYETRSQTHQTDQTCDQTVRQTARQTTRQTARRLANQQLDDAITELNYTTALNRAVFNLAFRQFK